MQPRLIKKNFENGKAVFTERKRNLHTSLLHGHDFYELDIITAGNASTTLNGDSLTASAGTVFFLTPEELHDYPTREGIDILNVQFQGRLVSNTVLRPLVESGHRAFFLREDTFRSVEGVFELLEKQTSSPTPSEDILSRLLEILLLTLGKDNAKETAPPSADMPRALTYIQEHFKENPPLCALASLLSLNERYFCFKFKEYTGKSYKEYLRERKLSYAKKLLHSSSHSVTEIAFECGYGTTSHFNREFKAYFGITPLAVRKEGKT